MEGRELREGEKDENVVLTFRPTPARDVLVAFLWLRWTFPGKPDLLSFAAITDEPPPEVAIAGHDRCIVPIRPENIDAWLNPNASDLATQYATSSHNSLIASNACTWHSALSLSTTKGSLYMATLKQIEAKMKKLQVQAEALASKKTQSVVDQIRELMLKHGLTTADIEAKASTKRLAKGQKIGAAAGKTKATAGVKASVAPKYQHPKTGATWTGRGRAPSWIAGAKDRNKFLIAEGAEAIGAVAVGDANKAKAPGKKTTSKSVDATAGKGQRTGPQPAKYVDPKSGATWSGRGPAPAWLASVKDRSRFLIGGAAAIPSEAGVASKARRPKAVAAKSPAAKKVVSAVKKVSATKAASKKAASVEAVAAKVEAPAVPNASTEVSA